MICCGLLIDQLDSIVSLALQLSEYRHQEVDTYWLYQQAAVSLEAKTADLVNQEEKTSAVVNLETTPDYLDEVSLEDLLALRLRCCSI